MPRGVGARGRFADKVRQRGLKPQKMRPCLKCRKEFLSDGLFFCPVCSTKRKKVGTRVGLGGGGKYRRGIIKGE